MDKGINTTKKKRNVRQKPNCTQTKRASTTNNHSYTLRRNGSTHSAKLLWHHFLNIELYCINGCCFFIFLFVVFVYINHFHAAILFVASLRLYYISVIQPKDIVSRAHPTETSFTYINRCV